MRQFCCLYALIFTICSDVYCGCFVISFGTRSSFKRSLCGLKAKTSDCHNVIHLQNVKSCIFVYLRNDNYISVWHGVWGEGVRIYM